MRGRCGKNVAILRTWGRARDVAPRPPSVHRPGPGPLNHSDHVGLIRGGVPPGGGRWADLGAGEGAFTLALADLLGPGGQVTAIDRDAGALRELSAALHELFPRTDLHTLTADFTRDLRLTDLDGVVMANALHFVPDRDQPAVLDGVRAVLKPGGRLVLVEYGADRGNPWVPHPFSYLRWEQMAGAAGFAGTRMLGSVPSRFLGSIYAAVSERPHS